ncbi:hypothetical protein EYF80_044256 [Liparis tanakae]|uniref:Uncharacterized protein n=1 Tax=Liparis tanakae TaxID=230148 RepID=A0A4Z2FXB8_9TELE|nr:hypothetical protein EYF80_044256 [Liparis tanakae]
MQMIAPLKNVTPCPEKEEQTERRRTNQEDHVGAPQETACKTQRNEARSDDIYVSRGVDTPTLQQKRLSQ